MKFTRNKFKKIDFLQKWLIFEVKNNCTSINLPKPRLIRSLQMIEETKKKRYSFNNLFTVFGFVYVQFQSVRVPLT